LSSHKFKIKIKSFTGSRSITSLQDENCQSEQICEMISSITKFVIRGIKYQLVSVGHYTCWFIDKFGRWIYVDNAKVEVLNFNSFEKSIERNNTPYLLFYMKVEHFSDETIEVEDSDSNNESNSDEEMTNNNRKQQTTRKSNQKSKGKSNPDQINNSKSTKRKRNNSSKNSNNPDPFNGKKQRTRK